MNHKQDFQDCLSLNIQLLVQQKQITYNKMLKTPGTELRQKYFASQSCRKDQSYTQYLQLLKSKGLQVNQKVFPSYFKLKNGLEYPGVATKEEIRAGEVLVRLPKDLVLTSFKAMQRPELQEIFNQEFYHYVWGWEDRVLNTYLLYIYGLKETSNVWYHMVHHLSKDIDILGFWPDEDLEKFNDKTIKSAANLDQQSFEQEWSGFLQVQKKYQLLQHQVFSKDNYRWIFTHLSSRCFGKQLQFTSMVPFCQFFNHHCADAHYDIQINQKPQQIESDCSDVTSQGSYKSQEYIEIGQYAYDQVETRTIMWNDKECYELQTKEKQIIQTLSQTNLNMLENQLKWDDFTILFVPEMIFRSKMVESQYIAGRKPFLKAQLQLKTLQQSIITYMQHVIKSFTRWNGKKYKYNVSQIEVKKPAIQIKREQFPQKQLKPYDNFILVTGKRDIFLPNNQVYFCYGRNSNRTLLLRYGFAIQGNKYQHVWLSFQISQQLSQYPDTFQKVQQKSLSLRRKFKVKFNRLNLGLIMFFRLNSWMFYGKQSVEELFNIKYYYKEIAILNQVKDALQFRLQQFQSEYNLQDSNLSYHQYFIAVYHQQKAKILHQHIQFMQRLICFIQQLQNGFALSKAKQIFTPKQLFIFRHYLAAFQ